MDYLKLIRAFWKLHDEEPFTGNETLLYWRLVDLFNAAGKKDVWPDALRFSDGQICLATGISPNTLDKFRKALQSRQVICVTNTGKGFRRGAEYRLTNTYSSSKRTSKSNSEFEELPERTSEFEELGGKEPQEVPQKEPQEVPQILSKSYIYISKPTNLPNHQTLNKILSVAHRDEREVLMSWVWLLKNKKKGKPPRLRPAPPEINIPFDTWWEAYDKRVDKKACEPKWNRLSDEQRQAALTHTGRYVLETPNPKYRKNPETYLNRESWNNEPLRYEPEPQQSKSSARPVAPGHQTQEQRTARTVETFALIDSLYGAK